MKQMSHAGWVENWSEKNLGPKCFYAVNIFKRKYNSRFLCNICEFKELCHVANFKKPLYKLNKNTWGSITCRQSKCSLFCNEMTLSNVDFLPDHTPNCKT